MNRTRREKYPSAHFLEAIIDDSFRSVFGDMSDWNRLHLLAACYYMLACSLSMCFLKPLLNKFRIKTLFDNDEAKLGASILGLIFLIGHLRSTAPKNTVRTALAKLKVNGNSVLSLLIGVAAAGDLTEEREGIEDQRGEVAARMWFLRQVTASVIPITIRRIARLLLGSKAIK